MEIKQKKLKKIPKFSSEAEEREFWLREDSTEYLDWSKAKKVKFPNLKPSTETISLRLPEWLLSEIKSKANRLDIPYQSYIKTLLAKGVGAS
jgi:predicted DNA binding CopG/RHH family protein